MEKTWRRRSRIEFPDWTECRASLEKQLAAQKRRGSRQEESQNEWCVLSPKPTVVLTRMFTFRVRAAR